MQIAAIPLAAPVLLAPMAGITDLPFRRVVAGFGAGLVVSEMVASEEVMRDHPEMKARAEMGDTMTAAIQLIGREPHWMAEAARMVEANGARIIDINMGCPAKRVTTGACGSALLKDLSQAMAILEAVVGAVKVPVTLKTRLGWDDDSLNAHELAARAEGAGIQMVTIHGRTRCQFYKGRADWAKIRAVKEAVRIPVVANGDILTAADARAALAASGADGVMIGRGAQGAPWVLSQVAANLAGAPEPRAPRRAALADLVCTHYEAMLSFYGPALGLRCARKHLGWYLEAAGLPHHRDEILTETHSARVLRRLSQVLTEEAA